jgi:hypothetical protein
MLLRMLPRRLGLWSLVPRRGVQLAIMSDKLVAATQRLAGFARVALLGRDTYAEAAAQGSSLMTVARNGAANISISGA